MKKTAVLLAMLLAFCAAAENITPQWRKYEKAEISQQEGIFTVRSSGRLGGIAAEIKTAGAHRYTLQAMVRGSGRVRAAARGSGSWAYSMPTALNSQWQLIRVSYFEKKKSFLFAIYNYTRDAITFEVKDVKITSSAMPCMLDSNIAGILYKAADYPGSNGKLQNLKGAFNGQAVWGKRYYNMLDLPVPTTGKKIYYYIHTLKNNSKKALFNLKCRGQSFNATPITGQANEWHWIKVGPISPQAIYPAVTINLSCDKTTQVWIDKVVLSTENDLSGDKLNSMEQQ